MSQLHFLNRILMRHHPGQPMETVHPRPASRFESQESPGQSIQQPYPDVATAGSPLEPHNQAATQTPGVNRSYRSYRSYSQTEADALSIEAPVPSEEPPLTSPQAESTTPATPFIAKKAAEKQIDIHFSDHRDRIPQGIPEQPRQPRQQRHQHGILTTPEVPEAPTPGKPNATSSYKVQDADLDAVRDMGQKTARDASQDAAQLTAQLTAQAAAQVAAPVTVSGAVPLREPVTIDESSIFINLPPGHTGALVEEPLPAGLAMPGHSTSASASRGRSYSSDPGTDSQAPAEPVVNVTIGRIEVRATAPQPKDTRRQTKKPSGIISLDKYLGLRSQTPENGGRG